MTVTIQSMIEIMITAEVSGVDAITTLNVKNLKWLPLNEPYVIKDNKLPRVIHEIAIRSEKGQVIQTITDFAIRVIRIDP